MTVDVILRTCTLWDTVI